MIVFVGLNWWNFGLLGSRRMFSAIVDRVYYEVVTPLVSLVNGKAYRFTRSDLNATSLLFGRVIPGSMRRRNSMRFS